ncbi:hypothetical protein Peetri_00030 [Pseudomonas phage vB_PpuM-Peetri]
MQHSSGRQELFLSRPEEVRVHYIANGESVDEAMDAVRSRFPSVRSPSYWVTPGEDATAILIYMRSGLVVVVDNEYLPRFVIQVPTREDGMVSLLPEHVDSITEDHSVMFGGFECNTVASLKVKGTAFRIQGESGCVDPAAFNPALGEQYAVKSAKNNLYPLEGYVLARMLGLAGVTTVDHTSEYQTGFTFDGTQQIMFPDYATQYPDEPVAEEKPIDLTNECIDAIVRAAERCWSATVENGGDRLTQAVIFPSLHDELLFRRMGTYLLELNRRVQEVTENKAMFFQCTTPGNPDVNLVLMNKEIGATMYPGEDGYFQLPRNFPMTNCYVTDLP